jgi:hypothetical protein
MIRAPIVTPAFYSAVRSGVLHVQGQDKKGDKRTQSPTGNTWLLRFLVGHPLFSRLVLCRRLWQLTSISMSNQCKEHMASYQSLKDDICCGGGPHAWNAMG